MIYNKKASGDLNTLFISIMIFLIVSSGFIYVTIKIFDSNEIETSAELSAYDSLVNENSEIQTEMKVISNSINLSDTDRPDITDTFEDNMLWRAFKTVSMISKLPSKMIDIFSMVRTTLSIPTWLFYPMLIIFAGLIIFMIIYFIRGMQK